MSARISGVVVIGEEGQRAVLDPVDDDGDHPGVIPRPDHLAPEQDVGLAVHGLGGNAEHETIAARPLVQRGHQARRLLRAARTVDVDEDEPPCVPRGMRPAHLGEFEGRVPEQRAIGEDQQITAVTGQRLGPSDASRAASL